LTSGSENRADDDAYQNMESLLDEQSLDYHSLRRGDVVEGQVMGADRDGVLVDVGSKSEGIVPPNEAHSLGIEGMSHLQPGDKILVYVLQPESAEGQIILSLDRARGERGWRVLQQRFEEGESFDAEVSGYNKGGLLVNVEGVNAFVPLSQLVGIRPERTDEDPEGSLSQAVGRGLRLKVIEINRRRNRVILSERAALQEWRSQQKDRLLSELKEGEIRRGRITSVRSFGVFIDLGGADGLAHLSELSWDRNRSPEEIYHIGDEVDAFVMKVDPETKKIALSLRRAQPERWEGIVDRYQIGEMVAGRVTKLVTFGAFARIDGPVEGLIHVSELVDRRINHPREVVKEGDILPLRIVRIERDRHRLGLSLKAARDEAERVGWEFADDGSIAYVPDEIREDVEARTGGPSLPDAATSDGQDIGESQQPEQGDEGQGGTPEPLTSEAGVSSPPVNGNSELSGAEQETEPQPAPTNGGQAADREHE
jgi:small subunit ribosomal protein S1